MSRGDAEDPAGIEWVDDPASPTDADVIDSTRANRPVPLGRAIWLRWSRRRWWYALAGVVVLGIGIAFVTVTAPDHHQAGPSTPSPFSRSSSAPDPSTPTGPPPAITVTDAGRPLLAGATPNWTLYARGAGFVLRLQLAPGRITASRVPDLNSSGPVAFLAAADRAIVRPLDNVSGFAVLDDGSVTPLTGALAMGGTAVAGPDPQHVWMEIGNGPTSTMQLVTTDGRLTTIGITVPPQASSPTSDAAGNLVFDSIDGMFVARPDGVHRITTGRLLAAGATQWLTEECDDQLHCGYVVIDRTSGARHPLNALLDRYEVLGGQIAPDGRTAALILALPNDGPALHLVDLQTGEDRLTPVAIDLNEIQPDGSVIWSPDSRWVFAIDAGGISAIDRQTGQRSVVIAGQPQLTQLALRTV